MKKNYQGGLSSTLVYFYRQDPRCKVVYLETDPGKQKGGSSERERRKVKEPIKCV